MKPENPFPVELCRSEPIAPVAIADSDATFMFSPIAAMRWVDGEHMLSVLKANGESTARTSLLRKLAAGETVELEVDLRAYQQVEGEPNRNFLRFRKGILRKVARSFAGRPVLRDHEHNDLGARAGTIRRSSAVAIDGGAAFEMTARLTAPWAVEALLRGNLDRFSIGWDHAGLESIHCTACKAPVFTVCDHLPGDSLQGDDGEPAGIVEFEFQEADGLEVSAVSIPAVEGTGISGIRAALSRRSAVVANRQTREAHEMKAIATALGLRADASEDSILAAIEARDSASAALGKSVEELQATNLDLQKQIAEQEAEARERDVAQLFADFSDRFPVERDESGEPTTSKLETRLRKLAEIDVAAAREILEAMPSATPTAELAVERNRPRATPEVDDDLGKLGVPWNPIIAKQVEQLGMTPERYAKHAPRGEK